MTGTSTVPDAAATGTILLMAAERGGCRRLATALRRRGLGVLEPDSPGEALGLARGARPSVVALDLRVTGVTHVLDQVHSDERCGRPGIALLVPRGVTPVPSIMPGDSVEVIEWDPADPGATADHLSRMAERQRQLRAPSPLTGLPGNAAIRAELEDRFARGRPTALLYVDLDSFKPYNDRYGFLRGDEVLRLLASLLVAEARRHPDAFVGHVGGDDFVLLVRPEDGEATARRIASSFDLIAPHLYDPADAARGRLVGHDRLGRRCRWPLLSVSVGVARSDRRGVTGALELTDIATEMKRVAKRTRGSAVAVDQRSSQDPPAHWRLRALSTLARPSLRRVASVAAAVLVAAALFVPAGGAIAMAKPGELLWPAARMIQDVRFALAGPEVAVSLRFELATALLTDAVAAFSVGDDERAAAALVEYRRRYGEAMTLLGTIERPVSDGTLVEISQAGDRQAALLSGLVESRCGQPVPGASACGQLRAALASVARTPDPPAGSPSDVAPRSPSDVAPGAPGTALRARGQGTDTTAPTGLDPRPGPAPVTSGGPAAPGDPPVDALADPPGGGRGTAGADRPGTPGRVTPDGPGSAPAPGDGDASEEGGASAAPVSPAPPTTAPPTAPSTTPPGEGREDTSESPPNTGRRPGPPADTPGPPADMPGPRESGDLPDVPDAETQPPGRGPRDGWNEATPGRPREERGRHGEPGPPLERPGAERRTGASPDEPADPPEPPSP